MTASRIAGKPESRDSHKPRINVQPEFERIMRSKGDLLEVVRGAMKAGTINPELGTKLITALELSRGREERVFVQIGFIRLFTLTNGAVDGWLQKAETAYKEASTLNPEDPEIHYYMARAYASAMHLEKAGRLYRKVLAIDKTFVRRAKKELKDIEAKKGTSDDPS